MAFGETAVNSRKWSWHLLEETKLPLIFWNFDLKRATFPRNIQGLLTPSFTAGSKPISSVQCAL